MRRVREFIEEKEIQKKLRICKEREKNENRLTIIVLCIPIHFISGI